MDTPETLLSESPSTPGSVSASEQARIRRERRKAKVGQGADRLKKITQTQKGVTGGKLYDDDATATTTSPPPISTVANTNDDPPEVDISEHFYQPQSTYRAPASKPDMSPFSGPGGMGPGTPTDAQLQQLMMSSPFFNQGQGQAGGMGGMGGQGGMPDMFAGMGMPPGEGGKDPMIDLMNQMFAGAGAGGPGGADGGLPPGLANMMSGMGMGMAPEPIADPYAKYWTLLHLLSSIILAINVGWNFTGTREMRALSAAGLEDESTIPLFWLFATMELVLQGGRFMMEKGKLSGGGLLGTIGGFLPQPFGGIVLTLARYSMIWTTIWRDGLTVLFVLGCLAWLNS